MLRSLIISTFCLFCIGANSARADTFLGLGAGGRLLKVDDGNFEIKFVPIIYGGYKIVPWAFAIEGLFYDEATESGTSYTMKYDHYEVTAYALRFISYEEGRAINPYVVGGLGVFQERLTTNFMGTIEKDKSRLNYAAKLGGGIWAQLGELTFITLEAKGMYSVDYAPDLVLEISSRVGVEF